MSFWMETYTIWKAGGPLMFPLAAIAFALFYSEMRLFFFLKNHPLRKKTPPGGAWAEWEEHVRSQLQDGKAIGSHFEEARQKTLSPINRRIRFYAILVGVCPLLGLLGTVSGMTATFDGMSRPGINNLSAEVASGVSQALVTTQTGLLIAIPGMILVAILRTNRDRLAVALYEWESDILHASGKSPREEWKGLA